MAILNDVELTCDEEHKIANSLNETEIETIETDMLLKKQAEHEQQQRRISRTLAITVVAVSCTVIVLFGLAMIIFANIFAPQH